MIQFLQSLVGPEKSTSTRTVVGQPGSFDLKEAEYMKASKTRLTALYHLTERYKDTHHEQKIRSVYNKTKEIHDYLVARSRMHELELFHLQHTDHFINTFTVIINVHRQNHKPAKAAPRSRVKKESFFRKLFSGKGKNLAYDKIDMIRPLSSHEGFSQSQASKSEVPGLTVPDISINTYAKIPYVKEDIAEGIPSREIAFTSTPQEKLAFLQYISERLGLENITYVGNAEVSVPNSNGTVSKGLVPLIHWQGFSYALNLNDYRIFPVRMYRKSG